MRNLLLILILLMQYIAGYCQIYENLPSQISNRNYFIENKGQWSPEILFLAEDDGMYVWITKDEIVFDFFIFEHFPYALKGSPKNPKDPFDSAVINGHVVKMKIINNIQIPFQKQEIIQGTTLEQYNNYYIGNNPDHWASQVRLFNSVLIRNYINGVDLKLYFDEGRFRYDFVTHTGVNPNQIVLRFEGQDEILVNNLQTLFLQTSIGNIAHSDLNSYQYISGNKRTIESEFVKISKTDIGFSIKSYDPFYPVVIDPIVFSTFLGGSNLEYGIDIDMDRYGAAVVGGVTTSTNYPTTTGAYKRTASGSYDIFIAKFNSAGSNLTFSTYLGGNGVDYLYALTLDYNGNSYITGYTGSTNYPTSTGCYQLTPAGNYDAMVTKINAGGTSLLFSTYIGGWWIDYAYDIELDASYNIYIAGHTSMLTILQTNYPTTSGAYQTSLNGGYDAFVTKLNPSGTSLLFSTYIGGSGTDYCYNLAIDANGCPYITGLTQSNNYPRTTGCYQNTFRGTQDAFVTKFNNTGTTLTYSTFLGGTSTEQGNGIAVDKSGFAYVTGRTFSGNFPTISGAYRTTAYGGGDCFITKLNTAGTGLTNSTYFGGTSSDIPTDIAVDINNNTIITGYTNSSNLPISFCAFQTTIGSAPDLFAAALNPSLSTLLYSSYFGGNSSETGGGIMVNGFGEAFITGYSNSANYPTTSGAYDQANNGGIDAIITKLQYIALGMSFKFDPTYCAGTTFSIPFIAGCSFNAGNVFSVQLSNASGSFASPVILGSVSRQTSGTINCKIPENTPFGTQYRIRMVSTNPVLTSIDNGFDININPKPAAKYSINKDTQCLNINSFLFTDSSTITTGTTGSLWNFGDDSSSSLSQIKHHYSFDSNFSVSLISVSDSGCTDTLLKMVTVLTTPNTDYYVNDSLQCFNFNLFAFTSLTTINKGSFSILWDFGDGDTTSNENPNHSFKSANIFNVSLISTAPNGCSDSMIKTMVVLPSPNSDFIINDSAQCLNNNSFIFTNKSTISSGTIKYIWIFGDGNTSGLTNPTHVYSTPDNYSILLISTSDSGCADTAIRSINLAPLPVAGFTVNTTNQCLKGNAFSFTNTSTLSKGNLTYLWDFGDGNTDTIKNPVHTYLNDGTYKVKLTAFSSSECTDTSQIQLIVRPSPKTSFTANDSDQCFNENLFIFTNTSTIKTGSMTHLWLFGDGITSASTNTTHRYISDNNFQVKLISTSDLGCKDTALKNIIVYSSPKTDYFVTDTGLCLDINFFAFSNNSTINAGTSKYLWVYGDAKTDTIQSPTHVYSGSGDYFVMLIATSDKNCKDTFGRMLHVYPMPVAGFTINSMEQCFKGNNFICTNSSIISSGNMTYNWNFGDGFISTLTNPGHSYANPKTYDITLIASSQYGCSDTFAAMVTIHLMPFADFSVGRICLDEPANFNNMSFITSPDSIIQYSWNFGDGGTSSVKSPVYTYTAPGTYLVRLTVVSNNSCRDSISKSIYIGEHVSSPVLDRVSVRHDASDIEIEWSQPETGDVKNYVLEKSTDSIIFQPFTNPGMNADRYIDADVKPNDRSYFYRIKALDSCNFNSGYSNIGKTIFLSITNITHIAEIKWTAYQFWPEGINRYEIEVYNNNIFDFKYVGAVDGNTLGYNDDVTALNQSEYCYRVAAVRNGKEVKAYSNTECVPVDFACFIPNAFSPNGDGLNDTLLALGTSVTRFSLMIFDRWGRKVFESNDIKTGWDGTFKGEKQADGYYYYQMSARGVKNSHVNRKGTLLLARLKEP